MNIREFVDNASVVLVLELKEGVRAVYANGLLSIEGKMTISEFQNFSEKIKEMLHANRG